MMPSTFNHRKERLSTGRSYHFVDQKPKDFDPAKTHTILCIHGFPDLWYGWRNQITPWAEAGYRVVVPDMLGYGDSDRPAAPEAYTTRRLCADLAALLDLLAVERAVVVGHDWGAATAWRFALYYPARLEALVGVSIPYVPPAPVYISEEEMAQRMPDLGYQVYFADTRSTKEIEDKLEFFIDSTFQHPWVTNGFSSFSKPGRLQKLLSSEEVTIASPNEGALMNDSERRYYIDQFKKSGMLGPLSYYRTQRLRFDEEKDSKLPSQLSNTYPVLFFWGTKDPSCSARHVERMGKFVNDVRSIRLDGKGHWLMLEAPDVIARETIKFLDERLPAQSSGNFTSKL